MSIKYLPLYFLLSFLLWRCSESQLQNQFSAEDHVIIYQELLGLEYALLTSNKDLAISHSDNLDMVLKNSYNLFCPEESSNIDGARLTNHLLKQELETQSSKNLLDDLRLLKATIINLETDDDYDPYFAFLWRFEEEMYATTQVAIDPMLNLYEWNEFENMTACMNESWIPVKLHTPAAEILDHDPEKYKNQTLYKIYLDNALEHFNKAVSTADYQKYPLCESAEALRSAYLAYIRTFIQYSVDSELMLAKM